MTVTDTQAPAPEAIPGPDHAPALAPPRPATGFAAVIGSSDHKSVGRLWIATSLLFLLVAGVAGGLLGIERVDLSGFDIIDADTASQVLSLHAVAGTFLFLVPLLLGLGIYVVPLQVGSASLAFPRAAAVAYWTYLISGVTVLAAFAADGGPGGSDLDAVDLFLAAMVVLLVALTLAAVCVATTGLALRAPGMGLHRTPLFTWANVVAAGLWVLTLPVLAGLLLLSYVDLRYGPTFLGGAGPAGTEQVYLRMAWAWSQPSVYVYAIPVLGIIGDIVPVAARTRLTLHRVAMGCIGAFAAFSFGAWAMPGFSPDNTETLPIAFNDTVTYVGFAFLVLGPLLVFTGLLADTIRRGAVRLVSPLVWAVAALLMLLAGAANGALVSIDPLDLLDTTANTAQIHYVLVAVLLGTFGGLAYWAPKLWGRSLAEGASTALAAAALLGTVLLSLPDLISGFLDQGGRLGGAADDVSAIEALNIASALGGGILVLVALGFIALVVRTATGERDALDDPWEGNTLEWATTSPPPVGNFAQLPPVTSEAPVYDARHAAEVTS
ncbi:MAG: cbb3-type cytochrome c oxidase subunit I [Acidimicrobiales bacterium]